MKLEELVEHWVRPEIHALGAYQVPDASGLVKLDAMENPYVWPEALRSEWMELLRATDVNRYPDPRAPQLTQQLRESMAIPEGMDILLGNGSDELIQMIAVGLSGPGRAVLSVDPGFVMYRMIATFCDMKYVGVPLRADDFSLDLPAVLQALDEMQPAVVFLAYPNNPTGNLFDADAIRKIIAAAPGLVVVDEAYAPFTDRSFVSELGRYDNLLIMRTVSKMGLAGLRLGYLAGPAAWLAQFDKVRLPYNINVLTQVSAAFALRHRAVFDAQTQTVRTSRAELFKRLDALSGIRVFPSDANFLLFRTESRSAPEVFQGLRQAGILIKLLDGVHPLLADCLRVTVGLPEENDRFISTLQDLV